MYLPKREELSLRIVLALPKATTQTLSVRARRAYLNTSSCLLAHLPELDSPPRSAAQSTSASRWWPQGTEGSAWYSQSCLLQTLHWSQCTSSKGEDGLIIVVIGVECFSTYLIQLRPLHESVAVVADGEDVWRQLADLLLLVELDLLGRVDGQDLIWVHRDQNWARVCLEDKSVSKTELCGQRTLQCSISTGVSRETL